VLLAGLVWLGAGKNTHAGAAKADRWGPWLEVGGHASSERHHSEGTMWVPLWQSDTSVVFADLRGKLFQHDTQEGNFALGVRRMRPDGWNIGGWGALDLRSTEHDNLFPAAAFGLEALHPISMCA